MRVLGAVFVGVGAGLLAGTAAAGPVPIPPLPTTTVAVPAPPVPVPVPVSLPPVPKPPPPVVAAPVSAAPGPPAQASSVPAAVSSGGAAPASSTPSSSSSSAPSSSSSSSADGARVDHFQSSRRWIGTSGPKRRRTTTFTFVLQQPERVVFTVNQVSPACVGVGHFSVGGHAGLNRVPFAGVVHGQRLAPGTYRIAIRTRSGRTVRRVTLVVVGGSAPSLDELHALRAENSCRGTSGTASPTTTSPSSAATAAAPTKPLGPQKLPQPKTSAESLGPAHAPNLHSGVLGSSVAKTARTLQPALVALLALAILLLGTASLPREAVPGPRVHDALARHRIELAGLGAVALVAVAVAFLFS